MTVYAIASIRFVVTFEPLSGGDQVSRFASLPRKGGRIAARISAILCTTDGVSGQHSSGGSQTLEGRTRRID